MHRGVVRKTNGGAKPDWSRTASPSPHTGPVTGKLVAPARQWGARRPAEKKPPDWG